LRLHRALEGLVKTRIIENREGQTSKHPLVLLPGLDAYYAENLEAVTDFQDFVADVDTYERRSLGGAQVPGMPIRDFTFTL
jgi:hypothetical protein